MTRFQIITISLIVLLVAISGVLFFWQNANNTQDSLGGDDSRGFIVSNSALYVAEQAPGNEVLASIVRLEKPGFLVIHSDNAGSPGAIIGASNLLPAGEKQNLPPIMLSRNTVDGETVYAMLHFDNGDGVFQETQDQPAIDPVGNEPVMMMVDVNKEATKPEAVNP